MVFNIPDGAGFLPSTVCWLISLWVDSFSTKAQVRYSQDYLKELRQREDGEVGSQDN